MDVLEVMQSLAIIALAFAQVTTLRVLARHREASSGPPRPQPRRDDDPVEG